MRCARVVSYCGMCAPIWYLYALRANFVRRIVVFGDKDETAVRRVEPWMSRCRHAVVYT
jgi:hypothetical protein